MNFLKALLAILLLPMLSQGQSIPKRLVGEWHPIQMENVQTGEIIYSPENRVITIHFRSDGTYGFAACNSGGGSYQIKQDSLHLQGGARTYKHCLGWEGWNESMLCSSVLHFALDESILELEVRNQQWVVLYRKF